MKQVIRINESQLRNIITESVKKVLKEENYAYDYSERLERFKRIEQSIEKCRVPYKKYLQYGKKADSLCEMLEDFYTPDCDFSNPKVANLRDKIWELRSAEYEMLRVILEEINSNGDEFLTISYFDGEEEDMWSSPYLHDAEYGSNFYRLFKKCMDTGKKLTEVRGEYFAELKAEEEEAKRKQEEWDREREESEKNNLIKTLGDRWVDDYKAPDSPLNVVGKIKLNPEDLNKKRW